MQEVEKIIFSGKNKSIFTCELNVKSKSGENKRKQDINLLLFGHQM